MSFQNAAIFVNGIRTMRNINVAWDEDVVQIINRSTKKVMSEFHIQELASERNDSMAWDVVDPRGDIIRMVAQVGCGCSGMKAYDLSEDYSGTLGDRK